MSSRALTATRSQTLTQVAKYAVVGGICTLLDMALLYALVKVAGIGYLIASILSFMMAATLNYFLCTGWIFQVRTVNNRYLEFVFYLLITGIALLANTLVMWLLTGVEGVNFMASKLVAVFITFVLNFVLRKYLLHREHHE